VEVAMDAREKMLKQNAVRSKNIKLKCREFSTLQKCEIKMQQKISVLQYLETNNLEAGHGHSTECKTHATYAKPNPNLLT